ncbi:MAG TPA: hypothetical protein VEJ87_06145 [Acidimicrobiales bacterium]|nr:hypothetical protein [Acidimicrobiales bacterium]
MRRIRVIVVLGTVLSIVSVFAISGTASASGGLTNYSIQTTNYTVSPGPTQSETPICPVGTVPLGGGFYNSVGAVDNFWSYPTATNGWTVGLGDLYGSDAEGIASAECATAPEGWETPFNSTPTVSGIPASVSVKCPAGDRVLGGGGTGPLSSSFPVKTGTTYSWQVTVNNPNGSTLYAQAVCGKKISGYKLVQSKAVSNPAGAVSFVSVSCPKLRTGQTDIMGGGISSSSNSPAVNITSDGPSSTTEWRPGEYNTSAASSTLTGYAICALT